MKKKKSKKQKPKKENGRPTDYSEQTIVKAVAYINSCRDRKKDVNIPTIEGLAIYLGVTRSTVYEWKDEYKGFSDILGLLMQEQGMRLINKGLSGKYNPTIAKLILSKHGYKDQVGLSGEGEGSPIKVDGNITATIDKIYGASSSVIKEG